MLFHSITEKISLKHWRIFVNEANFPTTFHLTHGTVCDVIFIVGHISYMQLQPILIREQ